jgi:hypothetical protein
MCGAYALRCRFSPAVSRLASLRATMIRDCVITSRDEMAIQEFGDITRDASPVLKCSPAKRKIPGVGSAGDKLTTLDRFS